MWPGAPSVRAHAVSVSVCGPRKANKATAARPARSARPAQRQHRPVRARASLASSCARIQSCPAAAGLRATVGVPGACAGGHVHGSLPFSPTVPDPTRRCACLPACLPAAKVARLLAKDLYPYIPHACLASSEAAYPTSLLAPRYS
jgi:hypothetical protein